MLKLGLLKDYSDDDVLQWIVREFAPSPAHEGAESKPVPDDIASVESLNATYEVLIARNDDLDYAGRCWIVLRRKSDGAIMEASGSHCSCYGFEDQWSPQASSFVYLLSDNCPETHDHRDGDDDYDDGINADRIAARAECIRLMAAIAA